MKRFRTLATAAAAITATGGIVSLARELADNLGGSRADITRRVAASPQLRDGTFHNSEPSAVVSSTASWPTVISGFIRRMAARGPKHGIPLAIPTFPSVAADLAVTWLGHASALVEIDGCRVLTDPMWSRFVSPTQRFGLPRLHPPPIPLASLPALDAIVISHDHFDHLDTGTIRRLAGLTRAPYIVPLGVGAHLHAWNVGDDRIIELDWWQTAKVGNVTFTCTPARHYSGRTVLSNNTLWASWSIAGPSHRVYFGGDTGPSAVHSEIADRLGLFDLTILPIGGYDPLWPDIHLNPPQALRAHQMLSKEAAPMLPIHWGTFPLAPHPWAEPIDWLLREAGTAAARKILTPRLGQRLSLSAADHLTHRTNRWWDERVPDTAYPNRAQASARARRSAARDADAMNRRLP